MDWHSIHVHYHNGDLDRVALDAVQPLFRSLCGEVAQSYFVRHWVRGPHLRLNVRTGVDTFQGVVRPAAERIVGGFLATHPSHAPDDEQRMRVLHRRLAALEQEPEPLLPWHPDNSVRVTRYDARASVLGSAAASDLLASFLADTTELSFAMLEHVRGGGERSRIGFDLMIAVAHGLSGLGIIGGYRSFRSHAEAFLCAWPEGRGRRAQWDEQYRTHRSALVQRVRDVVATLDGDAASVPFVTEWVTTLRHYQIRGRQLLADGVMSMEPPGPAENGPLLPEGVTLADMSPYHRTIARDPRWQKLRESSWFPTYRLVLNYCYVQLTRLGVTPEQRFLLCHLAANAVEDGYHLPATPRGGE